MADIALIFHWAPETMDPMPISRLMSWRTKAAKRHNPEN